MNLMRMAGTFLIGILMLGARFVAAADPDNLADWTESVRSAERRYDERWSALVVDLDTGREIFSYRPGDRLIPASNRKIVTFGMAMETLGPDHRFRTVLGLTHPYDGQSPVYEGDLVLRSWGDPSLTVSFMEDRRNPVHMLRDWIEAVKALGIRTVRGNLVVDGSVFGEEQNRLPSVWKESYEGAAYAAVPSGVALNMNMLQVSVEAGEDSSGRVSLYPSVTGIRVINDTRVTRTRSVGISAEFNETGSELRITGRVRRGGDGQVAMVPLPQPMHYIGLILHRYLVEAELRLEGEILILTRADRSPANEPLEQIVAEHLSPELPTFLLTMMRRSNNFIGEQVWRAAGARVTGRGDVLSTRRAEIQWFRRYGLDWIEPGWDGSGLSRENLLSSRELVSILTELHGSPHRTLLLECLPRSGRSGTLRHRAFAQGGGRIAAKTGSLAGVSALSGYVLDEIGAPCYVFSVIGNAPGDTNGRLAVRVNQLMELLVEQMDRRQSLHHAGTSHKQAPALKNIVGRLDNLVESD